ncbi:hypothetical protein D9M68_727440 [compost metagenome]
MDQAAPLVHDVGIDAVREGHAGHRGAGPGALGQDLLFEFGAVAPTGLVLGFGHGVHLSRLVDTIVAAYAAALKGGLAGRLLRTLLGGRCFASLMNPPSTATRKALHTGSIFTKKRGYTPIYSVV